jgi:hypothetical protein
MALTGLLVSGSIIGVPVVSVSKYRYLFSPYLLGVKFQIAFTGLPASCGDSVLFTTGRL